VKRSPVEYIIIVMDRLMCVFLKSPAEWSIKCVIVFKFVMSTQVP